MSSISSKKIVYSNLNESKSKNRLDLYLSSTFNVSRNQVHKWLENKFCNVNNEFKKPSYLLNEGDIITIDLPESKNEKHLKAEAIDLNIVYEDNDLIVLNKAFGQVVHPSHGHENGTLVNALLHHCNDLAIGFHEQRPGIVHRLDKDTGGLIVVAKTQKALTHLAEQFKLKTAGRKYIAFTFGKMKFSNKTVENYLIRDPKDRKKFSSSNNSKQGKFARTHIRVLYEGEISICELKLDTGRTHQIRVHLSELHHPIINDAIYGTTKRINQIQDARLKSKLSSTENMFLFAKELDIVHPTTLKTMNFKVDLPLSFKELINYLNVHI